MNDFLFGYPVRETFHSPYQSCGEWRDCRDFNGKTFVVNRVITQPDDSHDAEVLPMFVITCGGEEFEAWPEEILQGYSRDWP